MKNFSVSNIHGQIDFTEPVDLIGFDLDRDIFIGPDSGLIYPYAGSPGIEMPKRGTKLNVAYNITLTKLES